MICPYCGKEIITPNKEHYFPQSICANDWDFYSCRECNMLKGQHIVYPAPGLFKLLPAEMSVAKFKHLWAIAPWDKYLSIVPAGIMRKIFDDRKWYYGSYMFSVHERAFYELDKLKEIYDCIDACMQQDPNLISFVVSPVTRRMYLLHTYNCEFPTGYSVVKSMNIYEYVEMGVRGWLVLGSAKCGVWRNTVNYKEYFRTLLGAPFGWDMS